MWYLDNNQIDQKFRTRLIASMKKDEHKLPYLKCLEEKITSLSPEYVKIAKEVAKDMSKILSSTDESSNNEEINKKIEKMKVNFVSNNLIHDNDFISASSFTNVLSSIKDDTLKKELLDKYNYKLNPEENKVSLNDIDEFWVKILTSFHSQETISELIKSYNDRFSHNAKIKVIAQKMDDQEKYRTFNEELTAKPTPSNSFYSKKWNYVKKKNNLKLLVQSLSDYDLELVALDQYLNVFGHLNTKDELELYSNASNYKTRLNYFNDIKSRYKNTKKLSKSIDKD